MSHSLRRFARRLADERGITGLETAIVLIAFVVVASVFAYAVLSTGLFSAERGKETVLRGLAEARSTLDLRGPVVAMKAPAGNTVEKVRFLVGTAAGGEAINLAKASTVVIYQDKDQYVVLPEAKWTATWRLGSGDLLDPGEAVEIEILLDGLSTLLGPSKQFSVLIKPIVGAVLHLSRTTPPELYTVTNLN